MAETARTEKRSLVCPVCNASVAAGRSSCPRCEEDLTGLVLLDDAAPNQYNQGLDAVRQGKPEEAAEHLLAALALDPDHVPALVVLGKVRAQQQRYEQAIGYWRRASELDPENRAAQAGIAKAERLRVRLQRSRRFRSGALLAAVAVLALLAALLAMWGTRAKGELTAISAASTAAIAQVTDRAAVALVTVTPPATIEPVSPTPTPEVQLEEPVRDALAGDPDLELLKISVQQAGTTIQLSGEVPNQGVKAVAEALAKGVAGVGAVDSTGLLVTPPDLAKQALEKLRSDPSTQGLALRVEQVGHSLRLSGSVTSAEARDQVIQLVGDVEGVDLVDAEGLSVAGPDLAMRVQQALKEDGALASLALQVRQVGAGIILQGSVPDLDLKLQAEALARHVAGVELVDVGQIEVKPVAVEYVVERGDSLVSIARRFYSDGAKWPVIFEANRAIIDRPALIRVGMRLVIPPLP
jgi:nucleoid-associated protein YgaU